MSRVIEKPSSLIAAVTFVLVAGCSSDDRVTQIALQTSAQQAEQNQELAQLNREVAEGTRRLVESRGNADQQLLEQQREFQSGLDRLEAERRAIVADRNRESLLATALITVGSLAACSLPLILCCYLLHRLGPATIDAELTRLLLEQLAGLPQASGADQAGDLPAIDAATLLATEAKSS
jgi:TolA-binding protein